MKMTGIRPPLLLAAVALAMSRAVLAEDLAAIAAAAVGADIVIVGEVHDNPEHHRRQARLIDRLRPAAVAFEMLTAEQATIANRASARDTSLAEKLVWEDSGWPPWPLYQPVFAATGNAVLYGMAVPTDAVNRAVSEGAAAVFGVDAARFGLAQPLPESEQRARERLQQEAHCNMLPESLLPGMVEAQRLRDAAFARIALAAVAQSGKPVVVITGTGHARGDWGMPAALRAAAPQLKVITIGQFEEAAPAEGHFDHVLVSAAAPREDPCNTLRNKNRERALPADVGAGAAAD